MGIGAYRHLVTLQHPAVVPDPATWYCALQPAGGQVSDGQAAYVVRGAYHPGITLETQILFEGRTLQVQSVNDLDERHTDVQLLAVEVVGRGTTPGGVPVYAPPTILEGPASQTIDAGDAVLLTVIAAGAVPLAYQWTQDGADLPGEIYQFLETGPITVTTAYAVRVSNAYGAVTSAPAIVSVALTYPQRVIADGATHYWRLNETSGLMAGDTVGGANGTISGGVTLGAAGAISDGDTAMTFDGVDDQIVTGANVNLLTPYTLEAWVKRSGTQETTILSTRFGYPTRDVINWRVQNTNGNPTLTLDYANATSPEQNFAAPAFVADGQWHHLVAVVTALNVDLYVDGVFLGPAHPLPAAFTGVSYPVTIGRDQFQGFGLGTLDEIAIYPRALTAAEIAAHYALGMGT